MSSEETSTSDLSVLSYMKNMFANLWEELLFACHRFHITEVSKNTFIY